MTPFSIIVSPRPEQGEKTICAPLIPAEKYRKLLLEKRYLLVYQIKESTVYADAVVDTRQDYGWLL
ncbi:Hypothetical protein DEACI_2020 [Acididesulfobacillus acetoxydans]|uniref:Uncharacterized protein n=1 Tax=Acididesulfobacillus acetoxydans TaxID=1561005 RepID=A0A8S0WNI7_9FIRM|nr:Hypothetical protein DEACI_2020 [Acididesulfobacillus acetoxydans]CEJ06019.1 Hypothetical protein DEACI_0465 [Acididesulfobacillus acetoxydans]